MWVKPVFSGWDKSGTLISKFKENYRDIDIKNITVSHCDQTKCTSDLLSMMASSSLFLLLASASLEFIEK